MDNRRYIIDLFKVVPMDSILVINSAGTIQRIYCPFHVRKRNPQGLEIFFVDAVKMDLDLHEVYIINNQAYYAVDFILVKVYF